MQTPNIHTRWLKQSSNLDNVNAVQVKWAMRLDKSIIRFDGFFSLNMSKCALKQTHTLSISIQYSLSRYLVGMYVHFECELLWTDVCVFALLKRIFWQISAVQMCIQTQADTQPIPYTITADWGGESYQYIIDKSLNRYAK